MDDTIKNQPIKTEEMNGLKESNIIEKNNYGNKEEPKRKTVNRRKFNTYCGECDYDDDNCFYNYILCMAIWNNYPSQNDNSEGYNCNKCDCNNCNCNNCNCDCNCDCNSCDNCNCDCNSCDCNSCDNCICDCNSCDNCDCGGCDCDNNN